MNTRSKFFWGPDAGATVGAAGGLMLAPRKGKESRKAVTAGGGRTWTVLKNKVGYGNGHAHEVEGRHSEPLG